MSAEVKKEGAMEGRGKMGGGGFGARSQPYGISALLVLPGDTARESRRQERGYGLRCLHRERERGVPVGILAHPVVFVAGIYQKLLSPSTS